MNHRNFGRIEWEPSALGFGCMRLPVIDGNNSRIDEPKAAEMLYRAIDLGVNYIDTAYPYHGGTSEGFVGKTLEGKYREKVKLATKLPSWKIEKPEDFDLYLNEQLERLRTDQIDFYLLHTLNKETWNKIQHLGVLSWLERAQADGRIEHVGFSFHDELSVFKSIVDAYQGWDFCQIQYNFIDQDYQAGKKGLHYAAQRNLGVVIMEPLRGGRLVEPPAAVQELWDSAQVERSPVDWALQWLWNQPEVSLVLSGMSTLEQVEENVASADRSGVGTLSEKEVDLVVRVVDTYEGFSLVPCTRCGYCMPCPEGVDIPRILHLYNDGLMFEKMDDFAADYLKWVPEENKADHCVVCGECQEKCPQDIAIPDWLDKIHGEFTEAVK